MYYCVVSTLPEKCHSRTKSLSSSVIKNLNVVNKNRFSVPSFSGTWLDGNHKGGNSVNQVCFCVDVCSMSVDWVFQQDADIEQFQLSLTHVSAACAPFIPHDYDWKKRGLWMYPACMLQRGCFYFKTHVCTITQHFHYPYPFFSILMEFNEQRLANGPRVHCIGANLVCVRHVHLCGTQHQ